MRVCVLQHARDCPWFFRSIDSEIYGDKDPVPSTLSPLDARVAVLSSYAEYATEEQKSGRETSREMLLKPLNQIFDAMPAHKVAFATGIRSIPKDRRPEWFGDEICAVLEKLPREKAAAGGAQGKSWGVGGRGGGKSGGQQQRQGKFKGEGAAPAVGDGTTGGTGGAVGEQRRKADGAAAAAQRRKAGGGAEQRRLNKGGRGGGGGGGQKGKGGTAVQKGGGGGKPRPSRRRGK